MDYHEFRTLMMDFSSGYFERACDIDTTLCYQELFIGSGSKHGGIFDPVTHITPTENTRWNYSSRWAMVHYPAGSLDGLSMWYDDADMSPWWEGVHNE